MKLSEKTVKFLASRLINRARRTPYSHLPGYMERYWLVPYVDDRLGPGCGPVNGLRHPLAWLFQKFGIAIRVHHILRSDIDRNFHDHPWNYATVILKNGYIEVTPGRNYLGEDTECGEWIGPGRVLFRKANSWHRLEVFDDMTPWTLFITGPKKQTWGFLTKSGKVPHHEYLKGVQ